MVLIAAVLKGRFTAHELNWTGVRKLEFSLVQFMCREPTLKLFFRFFGYFWLIGITFVDFQFLEIYSSLSQRQGNLVT